MRILIVDDCEVSREALGAALAPDGHEIICACNGHDALQLLRNGASRLVISDWMMPELDGLELCRAIRGDLSAAYVYIVLLTGRDRMEDVVEGLNAGADDFLTKPFRPEELRVRVRAGQRILSLETRDMAIFAMAKLAESRDPETGAHLDRVRSYCRVLAQQLAAREQYGQMINSEFVRLIYLTSPLHDIGKVGIPDSVLLKPGRLSDREFEIMKTHTTIGSETLSAAMRQYPDARFLRMARDIALSHHERYDGSGYPSGLAGETIPLCGRIVALADVYDALTSRRVYKPAFSHDVAVATITGESGTHFDPRLVEAFLECSEEFVRIRSECADAEPVVV